MKSRYDVLQSATDRRHLAVFRSSSAVGIVMSVLVIGAVIAARPAPDDSRAMNLFGAEIAAPTEEARVEPVAPAADSTARPAAGADAEFEFPPHYVTAPAF